VQQAFRMLRFRQTREISQQNPRCDGWNHSRSPYQTGSGLRYCGLNSANTSKKFRVNDFAPKSAAMPSDVRKASGLWRVHPWNLGYAQLLLGHSPEFIMKASRKRGALPHISWHSRFEIDGVTPAILAILNQQPRVCFGGEESQA
jgi:hypothetical protein